MKKFFNRRSTSPPPRAGFVAEQCGENSDLQREVEKLLADYASAESFIESPVWTKNSLLDSSAMGELGNSLDERLKEEPIDPLLGRQIGAYRLEKEIGRGGMGAVYQAERADGSFRQRVAVKLIKRGMDTDFILRRFRQERQILAQLNHPFIAQLLDGGTTADNLPYFVMEFIEGEPLYKYSDRKKLTISQRLKLFRQICQAIDFAHQNQIIHRDIKPPNILVGAGGTPKLLDFGIAKVLNPEFGIDTIDPTLTAMRLMTPEYASPEQVCGSPVTPASDIYALGVLLYELLTGHRPYRFKNRAAHEIARVICEEEPDRPSTGITRRDNLLPTGASEATTLIDLCRFRGAERIEDLQRELAGDIERIILKCLRKEPGERYQTAAELEQDIARYLEGKPVAAESFSAIAAVAADKPPLPTGELAKSLAVLPLKILSRAPNADTGEEFLSVGLADALITRLSAVQRLVVRPTSSVLRFGEKGGDAFAAGRELGADYVVDGNIRRVGERIRVTAQLLNVKTNSTLWSESFDEQFTDFLALEDSISERVVKSLIPRLTGEEEQQLSRRGTSSPAAYEAYLRGRYFWNQFTPESLSKALESFQTAIALDPDYALAHVGAADFYAWANIYGLMPSAPSLDEAERHARRAVEIDGRLGEAYATLGHIAHNRRRWAEAEKLKRRAVKLNPNYVHAHEWWAAQLIGFGETVEGVKEMRLAESLDPLSLRTKTLTAWTFYQARYFEDALQRAGEIIDLDKNYPQGYSQAGHALWALGRYEEALTNFQKFDRMIPNFALAKYQLCFGLAAVNRNAEAREVLEEIKALAASSYVKPFFLAMAYVALDERDLAFEYFERSFEEYEPWLLWFGTEPMLDNLRGDARYFDLLRRMNNPIGERQLAESKKADTGGEKSIVVLPLKILGADTLDDDDYLSVGLADALITRLSNVRRFVVRPTSSVLQFGTESSDSFAAGRKLGVDYVVDGNIRRVGERIRVSLQLLNINENSTRWAEKFDEHFTDVLELEDTISERVAESLIPRLMDAERERLKKRGTDNPQAYEAYLRGRFYWNLQSEESFAKAITFFERAVELDPNYALAYTAIAEYYIFLGIHCVVPFTEKAQEAKDLVEKAVSLDPSLAAARAMLGFIEVCYNRDWAAAETHLRHALQLNPNSVTAHNWLSTVFLQTERFDEAVGETDRVIELDPDSLVSLHIKAWTLYHSRRFAESIEFHEKLLKGEANYAWGLQTYSWVLRRVGRFAEAVAQAERSVQLTGENPFYLPHLAAAYAEAGMRDQAEEVLARLQEISKIRFVSEYMLALAYCALGDKDRAFENLEKSLAARDGWLNWLAIDPQFDVLRRDERYEDLLRRAENPSAKPKAKSDVESVAKGEKSIAVLPLSLLGSPGDGTGDDYLRVGLADALITRLSNVRRFVVRPTSAVLPYGKKWVNSFVAGRELGVDFVVDGSIRRSGTRIRVTAQLLSVRENATRWAQTYDENFVDVLTLEDSISEQIARSLLPHLTGEDKKRIKKRGTDNVEAFEAYLRGRHYWNTFTEEGFAKSLIYFNQAISVAPDYALAYAGIADYHNWLGIYAVLPFAETAAAAKEAAERAVALDADLPEAHSALGFAAHSRDFDWQAAEASHRRALELNPNYAVGRVWYCHFLTVAGRFDEALREVESARKLDPLTPIIRHAFSWTHFYARRFDESIKAARRLIADEPTYGMGYVFLCLSLLQADKHGEAIDAGKRCVALLDRTPYTLVWLASAYAASGEAAEAKKLLAEIEELSERRFASPYLSAMVYCNLQETQRALALLEEAWETRDARLLWLGVDPQFDRLRGEPRFKTVLRQTNNPLS